MEAAASQVEAAGGLMIVSGDTRLFFLFTTGMRDLEYTTLTPVVANIIFVYFSE